MRTVTFYYEACPVCGRTLRVDIRYLGRRVLCSHCEGQFVAGQQQFPTRPGRAQAPGVAPSSLAPQVAGAEQGGFPAH